MHRRRSHRLRSHHHVNPRPHSDPAVSEVRISAAGEGGLAGPGAEVGALYDSAFVAGLPDGVDSMGENGEFHTRVVFNTEPSFGKFR